MEKELTTLLDTLQGIITNNETRLGVLEQEKSNFKGEQDEEIKALQEQEEKEKNGQDAKPE